ncbi:MAG: immunoglobulin domain-containing protein [Opitutaceae bacterium]|nr:immunoglobulin domain-containing protein [Opitutaceae bacterium]
MPGSLADPQIALFNGSGGNIGSNDNWSGTAVSDAATIAGLIPLAVGSRDSALVQSFAAGAYTVQVSGVGGTTGLGLVEFAVSDADRPATFVPALIAPILSQSVTAGTTARFYAAYIAKPFAVTFQWRKNGVAIVGATGGQLTLTNAQPADAGDYSVVITNSAGAITTAPATLTVTVDAAPVITIQPAAQAVVAGGTATFAVVATGQPAPTYQWLFNGATIAGATAATLTRTNVQAANVGTYSVRVTNSIGTVTSAGAALTIVPLPVITAPPAALSIVAGSPASFTVAATGTAPLTYQWRKDGVNLAGATAATFAIAVAQTSDAGSYTVVVTNPGGSVTSAAAALTVARNFAGTYFGTFDGGRGSWALVVTSDRVGTFVGFLNNPRAGIVATVAVAADGTFRTESTLIQPLFAPPVQILSGRPVAAASTAFTLSGTIGTTAVTGTLEGLNVPFTGTLDAPIGGTPSPLTGIYQTTGAASAGTTYTVVGSSGRTVMAMTIGPTLVDGGLGTLATNGAFTLTTPDNTKIAGTVVPATGGITTAVTPAVGAPVTATGSRTEGLGAPVVTQLPAAQTVTAGAAVTLTVTAGGRTPLTYQWKRDGSDLPGATAATLTIAAAQPGDAGAYTCLVTNADGAVATAPAALTVAGTARIINLSILTAIATAGESVALGYVVEGSSPTNAKPLVIRAAGPSLGALGVPGTLADPKIELYAGAAKTGENDNWGGSAGLATAMADVAAFPYTGPTSRDAATLASITTRENSVVVSAVGAGTGTVIAEVYDATPPAAYTLATPRLVNVSVLKQIGSGFTLGFVISGVGSKTMLIRAVGPGLTAVGVSSGFVADPRLTLLTGSTETAANDNWGGTPALAAAMTQTGAFAIPAASGDAALLATLPPGQYSAKVEAPAGATGLVLVEVYDVP